MSRSSSVSHFSSCTLRVAESLPRPIERPRSPKRGPKNSLSRVGVEPLPQVKVKPLALEAWGKVWLWVVTRFARKSDESAVPAGNPPYWKRLSW